MVFVVNARNVNEAYPRGLSLLREYGVTESSRNGPVLRCIEPVVTVYERPAERVLFSPARDANPFFHAVEAIWMIGARNDIKALTPYVPRMAEFSDDGGMTQPAAYGKRWRDHTLPDTNCGENGWGDQLDWAVKRLRANPSDRRVVITMWDPDADILAADAGGKDVPCNLQMLPWVQGGALHLTLTNRSNDIIWGLYGANAVHFSFCQEYLAARLGLEVGTLTVLSNNFHAYANVLEGLGSWPSVGQAISDDPYRGLVKPYPIFKDWDPPPKITAEAWDWKRERLIQEDLRIFFEHSAAEAQRKARWPFIRQVAAPLALAHKHYRKTRGEDRYLGALEILQQCRASDWQMAAEAWIRRRYQKWIAAADDGVQG